MAVTPSKISAHVRFMLLEFNDSDDYHSLAQEICEFFDYGVETSMCVLKTCLDCFIYRKSKPNTLQLEELISLVLKRVLVKPNFETLVLHALKDIEVTEEFLDDITSALHLSTSEKICFGLSLTYSERSHLSTTGRSFCKTEIDRLCANPLQIASAEQIQNILLFFKPSEGLSKHLDSFLRILSFSQSSDKLQFVLKPFLSADIFKFRSMDFLDKSLQTNFDDILTETEKETNVGDVIEELGFGFTANPSLCEKMLSHFLPLTEATISRILVGVLRTYGGHKDDYNTFTTFRWSLGICTPNELPTLRSWNVDILFKTIKQLAPGTSWIKVIENLDHEGFDIPDMEAFSFFMRIVRSNCKDLFPLHAICSLVWKNMEGQLSFLKHAILAPPEIFTFAHSARKLACTDSMHSKEQLELSNFAWLSLDLLNILCQLAEKGLTVSVRSLVQYPLSQCPITLLLGMAHIKTAYNVIQREVVSAILPGIIKNAQDSGFILNLWQLNRELVIWGLLDAQNLKPVSMLRIIDICHEHEILSTVIELVPLSFGIRLAILASKRGFLEIEKWLTGCFLMYKDVFFEECLKVIKDMRYGELNNPSSKKFHSSDPTSKFHLEATSLFLKVLKPHTKVITSPVLFEETEKVLAEILDCYSKLLKGEAEYSSASTAYEDGVEAEANSYFHRMFSGELSVDEMIQMLSRYKDSLIKREKSIFECMIANLFEEYSFFSEYPERQLKIAAILFGSVIKHQLLSSTILGVALRSVLNSLHKPADSKMFLFGTKALEQFVNNIELRQYCSHVLLISHLRSTHPDLVAVIKQTCSKISPGQLESDALVPQPGCSQSFPRSGEESGLNINSLVSAVEKKENPTEVTAVERKKTLTEAPPSEVLDKISFIINNVSPTNVDSKVKEFAEILSIQYYPWFAQYIVTKRASIEDKFHELYSKFLEKVNSQPLYKEIVQATYANCKILLGSELIKSNIEERILLKNLGSWLGKMTIGRNHVLLAREIDPKSLIVNAYEKGLLTAIIPFTSKVLEPCQSSIVYQLPNPWTMRILELLSEVYSVPNLKMNLKFEIEIFFKKIGVNIKDVKASSLLKDRKREIDGNPDISFKDCGVAQGSRPQMIDALKSENLSPYYQYPAPLPTSPSRLMEDEKANALSLSDHLSTVRDETFFISQVSMLFAELCDICKLPGENDAAYTRYVLHLHQNGLLEGDDKTEMVFRILTEYCVAQCISAEEIKPDALEFSQQVQNQSFTAIDIYAKLVYSIWNESSCKSSVLSKIMHVTVRSVFKDARDNKTSLNPRAYFRLFINWLLDFCPVDSLANGANCQVLTYFANVFHELQPLKIPEFSFAWLELVTHRSFMPKLLSLNGLTGWPYAQRLLVDLLQFLERYLRMAVLGEPVNLLYKGTLKVLLLLLHDYPEFLCVYHFTFCNVIPPSCIQMRNIILSSFPRKMRLPDPFTPNLKIDLLPDMVKAPCILSEVDVALKEKQMKSDLDDYLSKRQHNSSFLNGLKQRLLFPTSEANSAGTRYNIPLVNSLVLYAGQQALQQRQAGVSEAEAQWNAHVAASQMFKLLSWEFDTEGRYLLLNAIANQLRYPNSHTHYFAVIMLYLFYESEQEIIKEQITRVLLERLIVNRPHPWGLLVTFIELMKNPRYGFWGQGFIRCAPPEIAKLLESVARSCGDLKAVD